MAMMLDELWENVSDSIRGYEISSELLKQHSLQKLLSKIDAVSRQEEGIVVLYNHIEELLNVGIFKDTVWENPNNLVPALVGGTLSSGFPYNLYEILSNLRLLKIASGSIAPKQISADEAKKMLEDIIISNFELVFQDFSEEMRVNMDPSELKRTKSLFDLILAGIPLTSLKEKLADEVEVIAEQRPIVTNKLEEILLLVKNNLELKKKGNENEQVLQYYVDALFHPSKKARDANDLESYEKIIKTLNQDQLKDECRIIGEKMMETGLVSSHQVVLLRYINQSHQRLIPSLLYLNAHGKAEYVVHQSFISILIDQIINLHTKRAVYGLAKLLERNLLSQTPVWNALNQLIRIEIHPDVTVNLNSSGEHSKATPIQLLLAGAINVLGQPLGVGQGNNPTCQSARGISMWSLHAPGKLLKMTINAATSNELEFRYEGELIKSSDIIEGVTDKFNFNLDALSIVLVPHLDKIYNEMMKRAMVKHAGQDPHVSVNPAFYGHWIQTGFISVYNAVTKNIDSYDKFVKTFYASYHPVYNGGYNLIYPVPLGIFITSAKAEMIGYHAISLLRVAEDNNGEWRTYFFNPNNEGRQNWGQSILPSVAKNGEMHGESSLPFYQFVSRVYAFHYNTIGIEERREKVNDAAIDWVKKLALESWGKKYNWQ